jgi:lipopolysaccharide export LptBFGC system permease protein LptF
LNRLKRLDLYIASAFLGPFLVCVIGFAGLFVVADFFSNIDDFFGHSDVLEAVCVAALYYLARLPSYLAQIMPVLTVLPAVIAVIRLDRSNELVAMRAAGLSSRRIAIPLLMCGLLVTLFSALNQEVVVPSLRLTLADLESEARGSGGESVGLSHVVDRNSRLILITRYVPQESLPTLTDVVFTWKDELGVGRAKRAKRAFTMPGTRGPKWYMSDVEEHDGKLTLLRNMAWTECAPEPFVSAAVTDLLNQYITATHQGNSALMVEEPGPSGRKFEFGSFAATEETWPVAHDVEIIRPETSGNERLHIKMMVWVGDRWLIFGGHQFGGIDPLTDRLREDALEDGRELTGSIHPSEIRRGEFKHVSTSLTLAELADRGERFRSERFRQRCWVVIWNRLVYPLANILLILLAVPLVFRGSSHGALLGIATALIMTLCFMACNFVSLDLGYRRWFLWRIPFFAGTFPTFLFAAVGVWLFRKMDEV